jgi:hypothetical protein
VLVNCAVELLAVLFGIGKTGNSFGRNVVIQAAENKCYLSVKRIVHEIFT